MFFWRGRPPLDCCLDLITSDGGEERDPLGLRFITRNIP